MHLSSSHLKVAQNSRLIEFYYWSITDEWRLKCKLNKTPANEWKPSGAWRQVCLKAINLMQFFHWCSRATRHCFLQQETIERALPIVHCQRCMRLRFTVGATQKHHQLSKIIFYALIWSDIFLAASTRKPTISMALIFIQNAIRWSHILLLGPNQISVLSVISRAWFN